MGPKLNETPVNVKYSFFMKHETLNKNNNIQTNKQASKQASKQMKNMNNRNINNLNGPSIFNCPKYG